LAAVHEAKTTAAIKGGRCKWTLGEAVHSPRGKGRLNSLITVAALIALNRPDQLRFHLGRAVENGVNERELIEAITHLAFYAGWPNAMGTMTIAKALFSKA
jgi:4-carboxymuconolactone decarboxylase